ncbi:MAG: sugar phosphate isomerase/epimerase [Candidatus Omnitrophica bacterium]|nr:sugar phosphate isomerase/epimerase [Candidatus Omnitrophota bacterium]
MKITKDNLFVSIIDESLIDHFFKKPIRYNFELALFCLPEVINGAWRQTVQKVKRVFKKYPVRRHIHGPFMELMYDSRDLDVRALAKRKVEQGLNIAGSIGAKHIVFHSTYNPLKAIDARYSIVWNYRSAKFWHEMIPCARRNNCTIVIENIFEERPDILKKLIRTVNSPLFKGCLDVGHAHIFSTVSLEKWITVLGKDLAHVHMHDNKKKNDDHFGLGRGTINFKKFFSSFANLPHMPAFVLEVKNEAELNRSLRYLKKNGYWYD